MVDDHEITKFIVNYNEATAELIENTHFQRLKPRPVTGRLAREEARQYLEWTKEQGVDPVLFMMARHDAHGEKRRIPMKVLHKVGSNFIEKYREWGEWKQSMSRLDNRMKASEDIDPDIKIVPLHEAVRDRLSDTPEVCASSHEISGGWHPASEHCQACSEAQNCKDLLPRRIRKAREWRHKNVWC
jgi:hypothetical protein